MTSNTMGHRKVFVSASRRIAEPITLLESEWLWLQDKWDEKQKLSQQTRNRLIKATNLHASSLRSSDSIKSLLTIRSNIDNWSKRTSRLRNMIWTKHRELNALENRERSKLTQAIKDGDVDLNAILNRYFNRDPTRIELNYPLALFDRLLKGSIAIGDFAIETLLQDTEEARETKLWFAWAALVLAILRRANIPVREDKRERLLDGPVEILKKLQSKLPVELQRRKDGDSLRKAAVVAYKMRKGNRADIIQPLLARWANGDFTRKFGAPSNSFLRRFDRLIESATKPTPKRISKA